MPATDPTTQPIRIHRTMCSLQRRLPAAVPVRSTFVSARPGGDILHLESDKAVAARVVMARVGHEHNLDTHPPGPLAPTQHSLLMQLLELLQHMHHFRRASTNS